MLIALSLATSGTSSATIPKRTLPELLRIVRQRSRAVQVAESQLRVAQTQKSEARRLWAPTGEFTYVLTGAPRIQCQAPANEDSSDVAIRTRDCVSTIDPGTGERVSVLNLNIAGPAMQAELRLTQPLFTFGKIRNANIAAGHGVEASKAQVDMARREMEVHVARAYWGLKAARASIGTIEMGRDELLPWADRIEKDLEDSTKAQFTINDLQRVKVALSQVDLTLADLQRGAAVAKAGLAALIGEETEIDDIELDLMEIIEHPISYYRDAAQTHRPEVHALDEGVAGLRSLANVRRSEMLPDLALVGGISLRYAPTIEDAQNIFMQRANAFGFGLFLAIRQPLDIFQKWARFKHARGDADVLASQRALAMSSIGFEIDKAYADLVESRQRADVAERGQRIARGWLNAVQQQIDLGTAEPRDLIDAARSYFELRLRYYQAILDVNVNTALLRRASGVDVAR